ncbi:unnamed protein product [Allacma fusca]|uniref:Uncharacterized protein n=1 Tax=Allacma fusca TaxID=39272 RepID=A0A8J2LR12_9HEXA|nr:unnamed protein product [Allacma fusca]
MPRQQDLQRGDLQSLSLDLWRPPWECGRDWPQQCDRDPSPSGFHSGPRLGSYGCRSPTALRSPAMGALAQRFYEGQLWLTWPKGFTEASHVCRSPTAVRRPAKSASAQRLYGG